MTENIAPAATVQMIDQTCDEPFQLTVQVINAERVDEHCVACDKYLVGRLAVVIHDSVDLMMIQTMCLTCFDRSVDDCGTRVAR
jgi:hypothetical protein